VSRIPTRLFVELCAGTAALSLAHFAKGDPLKSRKGAYKQVKPPVSRMGSKAGYAEAILDVLGLEPGEGREVGTHYLWCEPDPGCRLLLYAYRKASLSQEAASILRGWAGEDPRALWERLRAEGPPRLEGVAEAREVARWLTVTAGATGGVGGFKGLHCRRANVDGFIPSRKGLAQAVEEMSELPATILPDARVADLSITLPHGTICYMDPPYVGTTQYANHLGRADVVAIARRWAAAGATVCISEAEPIPDLVADGWEVADITGRRKGQRRTFSKQQSEYLTIKRATP